MPAVLATLRTFTAIDSGTGQAAGMAAMADAIEALAAPLGGTVQRLAPANNVAGPNVLVTFRGTGRRRILVMAHMDTVYPPGTAAARPMRIDGNRAIAPGIADDKGGIALVLHAMKLLHAQGFRDYERITLLFNSDEERASFGSRDLIRTQAQAHDVVLSAEPTGAQERLILGTSGVGQVSARVRSGGVFGGGEPRAVEELADLVLRTRDTAAQVPETRMNWTLLRAREAGRLGRLPAAEWQVATLRFAVTGRASHAGVAPEAGVNAVVEAALLLRRVLDAGQGQPGVQLHARSASGGLVSNIIPERAQVTVELAVPRPAALAPVADALLAAGRAAALPGAVVAGERTEGLEPQDGGQDEALATADVRVPDEAAFAQLARLVRERAAVRRVASTAVTLQDGLFFPPYNASPEGRRLAEQVREIDRSLGGALELQPRTYGGTDAAWAAQSGTPVVEGLGLAGGNYHSSEEEFVFVDRIARRLALVAETLRAMARR